jgi:hypothetical protein
LIVARSADREDTGVHRRNSLAKIGAESGEFLLRDDDSGADRIARTGRLVIAGHSRSKNGVASLAYDPAISMTVARLCQMIEMTGTSPVMTLSLFDIVKKNRARKSRHACETKICTVVVL